MIRVLMVGPQALGGISTLAATLVPVLEQRVELLYLPTAPGKPHKESGSISPRNLGRIVSQYSRFLPALHRFRPDIVHLHTSQGSAWLKDTFFVLAGKTLGRRVVLHVHAASFDELYGERTRFTQRYTRAVMGLADAVIAVSTEWRGYLERIVPIDRIFAFRNCIAVDALPSRIPDEATAGVKALFLGSIGVRKGAIDLLEAVSRLESGGCPFELWIAGGEEKEGDLLRLRTRLEELHLEDVCRLVGEVRGAEKARLLEEADLFVLPSYHEGLPMAILEAMAAGLAVIATPVGGIPEVVREGHNGFLVAPGDVEALAERLTFLVRDRDLREVMGRRSREIAERELDVKPYVERLVSLYESLVEGGRRRVPARPTR
jgi:glycosyltransferase involved in cell wall biosynthesis